MSDFEIKYFRIQQKPILLKIWNAQKNLFGIPYNSEIDSLISNNQFLYAEINKKIVAIGAYKIMRNELRACHLWTAHDYRRKGIQTQIIKRIIKDTQTEKPLTVTCVKGAENNKFYDKIKSGEPETIERQTVTLLKYNLDKNIILDKE